VTINYSPTDAYHIALEGPKGANGMNGVSVKPKKPKILETINWKASPFSQVIEWGKGCKIKGVALRGGQTSRNGRKYVAEEIMKAARTLIGKPITINHDSNKIVGNVEWAEFSGDELDYSGSVKNEQYATMIRSKDSRI